MQPTIYYSLLTSAVTRSLKGESDAPILEKLDLSNGFIGPDELKSIAKCVHQYAVNKESQSTLNSIVLSGNQLCGINIFGVGEYDNSGFHAFCLEMHSSLYLKRLVLSDNCLNSESCQTLSKLLKSSCPLKELLLKRCQLNRDDIGYLYDGIVYNRCLSTLDISDNFIGAEGTNRIFKALADNRRSEIKFLNISNNRIGSKGAEYIEAHMRLNTSLIALISDDNELGDAGAEHIATLITRERLSLAHLSIQGNLISNRGLQYIAESIEKNKVLSFLGLQWNAISDNGASILALSLVRNMSLKCICLIGNNISPVGARLIVEGGLVGDAGSRVLDLDVDLLPPRERSVFVPELSLMNASDIPL